MLAKLNPKNNLAHCFACGANFNTIDLLQAYGYPFLTAVALLEEWLDQHQVRPIRNKPAP